MDGSGNRKIRAWWKAHLYRYDIVFAVSSVIAILLLLISLDTLFGKATEGIGNYDDFVAHLKSGWQCLPDLIHFDSCAKSAKNVGKKDNSPTLFVGAFQIAGVISITWLWYLVFETEGGKRRLSLAPTIVYAVAMFNAYQPAVLVAALIAIYFAVEHYSNLKNHERKLGTSLAELKDLNGKLRFVNHELQRIQNSTQLQLNKEGHELFMQDVYNAYTRAKTIHAVIRDHTIEEAWWECAETHLRHSYDLEEVWQAYAALHPISQEGKPASVTRQKLTMFAALTQPTETGDLQSAYFVTYMPMPGSNEWDERKRNEPAGLFNDLLGLAWESSFLNRVRTHLQKEVIGEWISRPLCWLHATDNEVWQIIKRNEITESTVLKIADRRSSRDNPLDTDLSKKIIEASQAEVPRYIRRGITVEEYLCAVLGYVYHDEMLQPDDPGQIRGYIVRCLQELNLRSWLFSRVGKKESQADKRWQIQENICVAIFKEFVDMQRKKNDRARQAHRLPEALFILDEVL